MATTTSSSLAQARGTLARGLRAGAAPGLPLTSLPADLGTVLKVVSAPQQSWHGMEPLLLEELQVFQVSPCAGGCAPPVPCL